MNLLLPALLMILYPLAPALRVFEIARFILERLLGLFEDEEAAAIIREDPQALAALNRWVCDAETMIDIVIGYLVREKLGLPFRDHRYSNGLRAIARSGKPLSFEDVFDRFERCVLMLCDIDRLAARRATRIRRDIDANPLGLADQRPTEPAPVAATLVVAPFFLAAVFPPAVFAQRIRAPP